MRREHVNLDKISSYRTKNINEEATLRERHQSAHILRSLKDAIRYGATAEEIATALQVPVSVVKEYLNSA